MCTLLVCSIITYLFTFFSPRYFGPPGTQSKIFTSETRSRAFSNSHPAFSYLWFLAWTTPSRNYSGRAPPRNAALWKKKPHFNHFYVTMIDQFLKFCFSYLNLWGKPWPFKLCFAARFPILWIIGCFVLMFIGFASVCFYLMFSSLIVLFFLGFLLSLLGSGTLFGRLVVFIYET